MRRLPHLAADGAPRERRGGGEKKRENTTLIGAERETNNHNYASIRLRGCSDSNSLAADGAPRERQETRERSEKREREYITSRITHNNSIDQ